MWYLIINRKSESSIIDTFCKDLLKNVVKNLDINDPVFGGSSSSNTIGRVPNVSAGSYNASEFKEFLIDRIKGIIEVIFWCSILFLTR